MLNKLGVGYQEKDISIEENLNELITKYGVTTTPVFVKGENIIVGGNLSAIKKLVS